MACAAQVRSATPADLREIFDAIDLDKSGTLKPDEVFKASEVLGFPIRDDKAWLDKAFRAMDRDGSGVVTFDEFKAWWNGESQLSGYARRKKQIHSEFKLHADKPHNRESASGNFLG